MDDALRNYAEALVEKSKSELEGQIVIISCGVKNRVFGKLLASCIEDAGAAEVKVNYYDGESSLINYWRMCQGRLEDYPVLMLKQLRHEDGESMVQLFIGASKAELDHDGLMTPVSLGNKSKSKALFDSYGSIVD